MAWSSDLTVAAFGALVAAVGFVAKMFLEAMKNWNDRRLAQRARLVKLQSLLLATYEIFQAQIRLRNRLYNELVKKHPELSGKPKDMVLENLFPTFSPQQVADYGVIRAYTEKALSPLNQQMADWLAEDTVHKSRSGNLGALLRQLETHLALWRAKYDFWIPGHPEHALVFLAGSSKHGPGFPKGIEKEILRATGTQENEIADYMNDREERQEALARSPYNAA